MKTEAISHLVEEHREIGRVLDAFENFLRESRERCKNTGLDVLLEPRQLWAILDYLSEHLLMRHEEKEELCVLPALARHGLSWSDTDLQHTRQEHRHVRYLMRVLRQAVHQTRSWSADDCRHFHGTGDDLVAFLRRHMSAEERHLFGKLDADLSPAEDADMVAEMLEIDRDFLAMPDAQKLHAAGEEFQRKYAQARSR